MDTSNTAPTDSTIGIEKSTIDAIMSTVMGHPYVIGAVNTITTQLTSDGFMFYHRNRRMRQAYRQSLSSTFSVLVRQLVIEWFSIGVAFVYLQPDPDLIVVPRIIPGCECAISFTDKHAKRQYSINHPLLTKRAPLVYVLERFPPLRDGTLTAPAVSLLFHMSINRDLWRYHLRVTQLRSRTIIGFTPPPPPTANPQTSDRKNSDSGLQLLERIKRDMNLPHNRHNWETGSMQDQYDAYNKAVLKTHYTDEDDKGLFVAIDVANHRTMQQLQSAQPVMEIHQSDDAVVRMVAVVTGIPHSYFQPSSSRHVNSDIEVQEKQLKLTLDEWSIALERVLSDLLSDMYAQLDQYDEFQDHWLRLQHLPQNGLQSIHGRMSLKSKRLHLQRITAKSQARLQCELKQSSLAPNSNTVTLGRDRNADATTANKCTTAVGCVVKCADRSSGSTGPTDDSSGADSSGNDDDINEGHQDGGDDGETLDFVSSSSDMSASEESEDDHILANRGGHSSSIAMFMRSYNAIQTAHQSEVHPDDRFSSSMIDLLADELLTAPKSGQFRLLFLKRQEELRQSMRVSLRNTDRAYRRQKRNGDSDRKGALRRRAMIKLQYKKRSSCIHRQYKQIVQRLEQSRSPRVAGDSCLRSLPKITAQDHCPRSLPKITDQDH
jgi:hypothetical protein